MRKRRLAAPKTGPREQFLSNYRGWRMYLQRRGHKQILVVRWSLNSRRDRVQAH